MWKSSTPDFYLSSLFQFYNIQNIVVGLIIFIRESNISNFIQYLSSYYVDHLIVRMNSHFQCTKVNRGRKCGTESPFDRCTMESSLHLWITERILYKFSLEMVQGLRTPTVLTEDQSLIPIAHRMAHTVCNSSFGKSNVLLWPLWVLHLCSIDIRAGQTPTCIL